MSYARTVTVELPYARAVERVREALAAQGFGVLTEIDVQAVLREKRGLEMEPYVVLGACNPDLAHRALEVDRGTGTLLPCNVVVSAQGDDASVVRVFEPQLLTEMTGLPALQGVADEAGERLAAVLDEVVRSAA